MDPDRFHLPEKRAFLKEELGLPDGRLHLLTVRNLEPRMGLDNLLKAVFLLKELKTNLHLVIGGEGPEQQNLGNLIRRYELFDNVTMTGFIGADQLPKYYQAADFFILPTRHLEGFGLVTVESLACGTPVIGTPVGGTKEILSNFNPKLLFKDTSPKAIAEGVESAIDNYFSNKKRYDQLRVQCREYAVKNYSWQRHINQLKSIIDEISCNKELAN